MIIVQKPAELADKILGKQDRSEGVSYRPIHYIINKSIDDGLLIYNVMTKCIVMLEDEHLETFYKSDFAIENWFSVPSDFDEQKTVIQLRAFGKLFAERENVIDKYTILTTTDCNARCFYCYEKGVVKTPMTIETAKKIVNFILAHYRGKSIRINWFGGEPLYNAKVIDFICEELKKNDVNFFSNMISNAYLFDEKNISKAKSLWNLKQVQVTLDGTEKVYNKTKHYIYDNVNPYKVVMQNINRISKSGISTYIRLNVDKYNIDDIYVLVDELIDNFKNAPNIYVYLHQLYENVQKGGVKRTEEERLKLFSEMKCLEKKLADSNCRLNGKRLPSLVSINCCMADSKTSIMILPSGELGRCEHYVNSFFCGDVEHGITNEENYNLFEEMEEYELQCRSCAFFPDCFTLKKCSKSKFCRQIMKDRILEMQKKKLVNTYNYYKKNKISVEDEVEIQC